MNYRVLIFVFMAQIPFASFAAGKPEAAWLINSTVKTSPAVEIWNISQNGKGAMWRLISSDKKVIVEMRQPAIPKGYAVNQGQCKVGGVIRDDVIALVRHREEIEWSSDIRAAWIADPEKKAFVPIREKGIRCLNESYGL